MKTDDFQRAPKLFCETIQIAYTPEFFVMALSSGEQATIYSLTPEHMKRLSQYLAHEIEEYEKNHKKIDAKWNPHVVSPVQKMNRPSDKS